MAVTVSIGRNVDGAPMPVQSWEAFQNELLEHVQRWCEVYFCGTGMGASGEWGPEEAYTVVHSDFPDWAYWSDYMYGMNKLREEFGQDAIAVTTGHTVMM